MAARRVAAAVVALLALVAFGELNGAASAESGVHDVAVLVRAALSKPTRPPPLQAGQSAADNMFCKKGCAHHRTRGGRK